MTSKTLVLRRRRLFFFLGTLAVAFTAIVLVQNLLISLILAFVGFNLLAPFVDALERRGFSRVVSVSLPFLAFSLTAAVAAQVFVPALVGQFGSLKNDLPRYLDGIRSILAAGEVRLAEIFDPETAQTIASRFSDMSAEWASDVFNDLPRYISSSLTVAFLAPFLCFFMLLDGRVWMRQLISLVPNQFFELSLNLHHQISSQMGGFIRARLLESFVVWVLVYLGLLVMGFPYALVLSAIAAVLNLIPYIGPVIGALPAFLIATVNGGGAETFAGLAFVYGGAQIIDTVLLVPFLVARIVNLHPVTVVLSVLVGSQFMGILGMIICIPLTSAMKVTVYSLYRHLTEFRDG